MRILTPADISLAPLPAEGGEAPMQSRVVQGGLPLQARVDGLVLEAAFECRGFHLLFTTDDVPQEDLLHITLFDGQWQPLDAATIGGAYTTGRFSLIGLEGEHTVRFRFIGDTDWSVEILPSPGFRMPLVSEPRGVARALGFSRHFVVRGDPQPQR
ncbi:hypothetical protein AVKW3434_10180 [Acidovorax sp. SUPP3434]|uniref:hypothetical protein n=1 Tax=Acidovorax sp. SUPP3434 TaxID=2920880 RepID=UPI0023DE4DA3|nr:hypothetical protein [Acidovorax sp. SUPP3434]GKS99746.1 hypothetical protein AVKW3434_10180 [Acidovorax sp. SUPP3434]